MPVQRTLFGQPVRFRIPPRRFQALFVTILFVIVYIGFYGTPTPKDLPSYDNVVDAVKHPHMPDLSELPVVNKPFGPSRHRPPVQPNSTTTSAYRAIEWLSDLRWRNPFSKEIALDENRAVLPPLLDRPYIYTYYNPPKNQDKKITEAENRLILAWRRAWWAQGFRPQVLSVEEAKVHPQFIIFQRMKVGPKVEAEVMRWLAWGTMRGGVLANWLALPISDYDNPMLSFLRRGEYPRLSRISSLDGGVFFGEGSAVEDIIKKVVANPLFKNVTVNEAKIAQLANKEGGAVVNLVDKKDIAVDAKADGIAFYKSATISSKYKTVADKLAKARAEGLTLLANLINSHLHLTFQELHPEGIVLVKPLPEHTTALMYEAAEIGRNLTQCPSSPMPKSCPPNRPKCTPCDANKAKKFEEFPEFVNSTKFFTIGTVPHPYTLTSLHFTRTTFDINFLRNTVKKDVWITTLTRKSIPEVENIGERVVRFKELVAAAPAHSLWLTAERISHQDLDWIFGFDLPQITSPQVEPSSPNNSSELIIFPRPGPPIPIKGLDIPDEKWISSEKNRLEAAREILKRRGKDHNDLIEQIEEWDQADTEVWKFARAYSARRRMERKKWEDDETSYSGSEKKAGVKPGKAVGGRWMDG